MPPSGGQFDRLREAAMAHRLLHSFPRAAWERMSATLCVVLLLAIPAIAADPQINMIAPYGLQRGTETELTITGTGMGNVKELLFYEPGFSVKQIESKADDSLKATIAVAPDCPLGLHAIRLRSLTGVSNLRLFTVGPFAEVKEVEPNNELKQAQLVGINVTVSGIVQAEDTDSFAVELKKGDRLTAELEGLRLGTTF